MKRKISIFHLLKKLQEDKLTSTELSALYSEMKQESTDLEQLISKEWEDISSGSSEINAVKVLRSIHQKGNFSNSEIVKPKVGLLAIPNRRLFAFSRYAAIFIIAFVTAWYMHSSRNMLSSGSTTNIKVAYGSKTTIELPDGSVVMLNSGSKLSYSASFGKESRTVVLNGEGFFEVKKNTHIPFYVKTIGMTVKVTGTKFNVKAYPDEKLIETTLVSGSVEIFENKNERHPKRLAILKPNQKAIFQMGNVVTMELHGKNPVVTQSMQKNDGNLIMPIIAVEVDIKADVLTCWKNNVLNFDNEKLSEISRKLERWYNVEIKIKDESLSNIRFSGKFDKESIQDVLSALAIVHPITYDINKNKIVIKSKIY